MLANNSIVDSLLSKIDLVELVGHYTKLTADSNGNYRGCCPIHGGHNPTSFVLLDDKVVFCHSCGFSGNAISFYCQIEGLPFYQAIEKLAETYSINLESSKTYRSQKEIVRRNTGLAMKFQRNIGIVKDYLMKRRNFSEETIEEFMLGYCDDPRFLRGKNGLTEFTGITFPIHDTYGRIVGFSKRRTDGNTKPTYVNSFEDELFSKGDTLFNLNRARKLVKKSWKLYVCEGYCDTISAHQQGNACVGYIGGYLVKGQLMLLKELSRVFPKLEFVFAPDNPKIDPTGAQECVRIRDKLLKWCPELIGRSRFFVFPDEDHKDFNDLHVDGLQISECITEGIDLGVLKIILEDCKSREEEYSEVEKYIKRVQSVMTKADIAKYLSTRWEQSLEDVKEFLKISVDTKDDSVLDEFVTVGDSIDTLMKTFDGQTSTIGFPRMDDSFGGVAQKEVVLIGAYSKVGKTDFICEIILHSILRLKMNCIVFSLEMPKEHLTRRLLMKLFGVNMKGLKEILQSPDGVGYIQKARDVFDRYLLIDDRNGLTLDECKRRVELVNTKKSDRKTQRVFIDYFQYLKNTNEFAGIEETAKGMKSFVKDLDCELYMLSQFSREASPWERPSIKSFKGGNSMESSFDKAILLWRPSKNPKLTEIDREAVKYQTLSCIESREELYGADTFELTYDPNTSRLEEK